jgi:hypothetical protein
MSVAKGPCVVKDIGLLAISSIDSSMAPDLWFAAPVQ